MAGIKCGYCKQNTNFMKMYYIPGRLQNRKIIRNYLGNVINIMLEKRNTTGDGQAIPPRTSQYKV